MGIFDQKGWNVLAPMIAGFVRIKSMFCMTFAPMTKKKMTMMKIWSQAMMVKTTTKNYNNDDDDNINFVEYDDHTSVPNNNTSTSINEGNNNKEVNNPWVKVKIINDIQNPIIRHMYMRLRPSNEDVYSITDI